MARRRWDDPWQRYPASVPLPVADGIATTRQTGPIATTWWSRRFTSVLESYGLGTRMQRGRRYARTGQVMDIEVSPGMLAARVQGSRPTPYLVTAAFAVLDDERWSAVTDVMRTKVGFVARLLDGEVPAELEEVFADAGVSLFPATWSDIQATCSCPDWQNPCKHIAAVLYLLADRLDNDPWLLLELRGHRREVLLDALTGKVSAAGDGGEIAPWWPFGPGPVWPLPGGAYPDPLGAARPEPADAVLDALEPLAVDVGSSTFVELLRPVYDQLIGPGDGPS